MDERSHLLSHEFDEGAEVDYLDAVRHYEGEQPGLSVVFEEEVRRGIAFILQHPEASPVVTSEGARKRVLWRFPYDLYYTIEGELVTIWAVAHQKRRPGYWLERLRS